MTLTIFQLCSPRVGNNNKGTHNTKPSASSPTQSMLPAIHNTTCEELLGDEQARWKERKKNNRIKE